MAYFGCLIILGFYFSPSPHPMNNSDWIRLTSVESAGLRLTEILKSHVKKTPSKIFSGKQTPAIDL